MTIELLVFGQDSRGIERFGCSRQRQEIQSAILADQLELCEMLIGSFVVKE